MFLYPENVSPDMVQTVCKGYQQTTKVAASKERFELFTVLPAKSDSYVMLCLQSYQGLKTIDHLCINPICRIGLILK